MNAHPSLLALETGDLFFGSGFGSEMLGLGEVVFNTSMTGYQEISTDPSYRGQIVTLTYPLVGNYGFSPDDVESRLPWIAGLVVRELADMPNYWRHTRGMASFLSDHDRPGIQGIDTRALTRIIRTLGPQRGVVARAPAEVSRGAGPYRWSSGRFPAAKEWALEQVEAARCSIPYQEQQLVADVSAPHAFEACDAEWKPWAVPARRVWTPRIALLDVGVKTNIMRSLVLRGCRVHVLPYGSDAAEIAATDPDGVVICNGPGDPVQAQQAVETVRELIGHFPLMGICLGHQILSLAIGATTSRLPFGHRGSNHPVKDLLTGRTYITSQNHGYQVDAESIPSAGGFRVSHMNLNDGSVEGITHERLPVFSVQYHPEGSPGPQDSQYLFDRFLDILESKRNLL